MTSELKKVLAQQVELWRIRRGFSTKELAKRSGMSPRSLNNILNPDRTMFPGLDKIEGLSEALSCTAADLLSPLRPDEEVVLDRYRKASEGRKASVRALLAAPADPGETPSPEPDQVRYERHIEAQQARWRQRDRLVLRDKSDPRQRDLLDPDT